jgi:two-component system, NarL family, invasion response regulator UvrY
VLKVLVADDRLAVREGLKRLVAAPGLKLVGAAATADEVLAQAAATEPDVVLLDVFLGGAKSFGLVRTLARRHPKCRVLVLNVRAQDPDALQILATGAAGYISKDHSRRELLDAIRSVARGATYVSPSLANALISSFGTGGRKPGHEALSDREYQVLCLVGSGVPFKTIAAQLALSPKTVSTYRSRILGKLGLKGNTDIVRYAVEHELVPRSRAAPPRRRKNPTPHRPSP